jgi:hypothetical protein
VQQRNTLAAWQVADGDTFGVLGGSSGAERKTSFEIGVEFLVLVVVMEQKAWAGEVTP